MSGILVALDGSVGSEQALQAAVRLAQQDGGRVAAVAVLEQSDDPQPDRLTDGAKAQTRRQLDELLETAANFARSRGVHLHTIACEGHPADAIITCAEQQQASLVVLGANRAARAGDGLGDTADRVSAHCPCTVLLVKS